MSYESFKDEVMRAISERKKTENLSEENITSVDNTNQDIDLDVIQKLASTFDNLANDVYSLDVRTPEEKVIEAFTIMNKLAEGAQTEAAPNDLNNPVKGNQVFNNTGTPRPDRPMGTGIGDQSKTQVHNEKTGGYFSDYTNLSKRENEISDKYLKDISKALTLTRKKLRDKHPIKSRIHETLPLTAIGAGSGGIIGTGVGTGLGALLGAYNTHSISEDIDNLGKKASIYRSVLDKLGSEGELGDTRTLISNDLTKALTDQSKPQELKKHESESNSAKLVAKATEEFGGDTTNQIGGVKTAHESSLLNTLFDKEAEEGSSSSTIGKGTYKYELGQYNASRAEEGPGASEAASDPNSKKVRNIQALIDAVSQDFERPVKKDMSKDIPHGQTKGVDPLIEQKPSVTKMADAKTVEEQREAIRRHLANINPNEKTASSPMADIIADQIRAARSRGVK